MKILLTTNLPKIGFTEMQGKADVVMPEKHKFTPEELTKEIADADFLISTFDYKVPESMMEAGKKLKAILKDADDETFTVTVTKKVKVEGKKRPELQEEDLVFNYNEVKYTKYLISFK